MLGAVARRLSEAANSAIRIPGFGHCVLSNERVHRSIAWSGGSASCDSPTIATRQHRRRLCRGPALKWKNSGFSLVRGTPAILTKRAVCAQRRIRIRCLPHRCRPGRLLDPDRLPLHGFAGRIEWTSSSNLGSKAAALRGVRCHQPIIGIDNSHRQLGWSELGFVRRI